MNKWFEVSVKATVTEESGKEKKRTEKYMMDGFSFTEVEARAIEELMPFYAKGDMEVLKISPMRVGEVFIKEGKERIFKCKINLITLDERSGKEKKHPSYIYVTADSTNEAEKLLTENMKGTLSDWVLESVAETKILEVLPYSLAKGAKKMEEGKEEA